MKVLPGFVCLLILVNNICADNIYRCSGVFSACAVDGLPGGTGRGEGSLDCGALKRFALRRGSAERRVTLKNLACTRN